ncbi:hypothetical protein CVM73_19915 [Bradyrhizobium forestalis]|uniref:Uncharacterized protein n=1 Tax=Bradyrhizobium forestalis TaxID=1419263 RepID=A0A2M8R6L1_9BRAD|nr:hypothetical protein CVM73_19915 [Bradyrhizobium forestalis]
MSQLLMTSTSSDCGLALHDLRSTSKLLLRWLVKSSRQRDMPPTAVDMFEGKCPRRLEVRRGHRLGVENGGTQTDRIVWG